MCSCVSSSRARGRRTTTVGHWCHRAAGPGDSFLVVHSLVNWYGRDPRIVLGRTWDPAIDIALSRCPAGSSRTRAPTARTWNEASPNWRPGSTTTARWSSSPRWKLHRRAQEFVPSRRCGCGALGRGRPGRADGSTSWHRARRCHRRPAGRARCGRGVRRAHRTRAPRHGRRPLARVAHGHRDRMHWWRVPADEAPRAEDAMPEWLYGWWERVDAWIGATDRDPASCTSTSTPSTPPSSSGTSPRCAAGRSWSAGSAAASSPPPPTRPALRRAVGHVDGRGQGPVSNAAFLAGRFGAYHAVSEVVMAALRDLSPLVEPISLDEAFVDLAGGTAPDLSPAGVRTIAETLRADIRQGTRITASVGAATSSCSRRSPRSRPSPTAWSSSIRARTRSASPPVRALWGVGPATQSG